MRKGLKSLRKRISRLLRSLADALYEEEDRYIIALDPDCVKMELELRRKRLMLDRRDAVRNANAARADELLRRRKRIRR